MTISWGTSGQAVAVEDPQLLARSNIWAGDFLDASKTPRRDAPRGTAYEISLFVDAGRLAGKKYVLFYYPQRGQGLIYLPGPGQRYCDLNAGAIMRPGRDGRTSLADAAWEALVKPVIERADAGRNSPR